MWISRKKMRDLESHIKLIKDGLWQRMRELEARIAIMEAREQEKKKGE